MKNGRMQCLGSPQQLKHKFGDGFSIVVQIKGNTGTDGKERLQVNKLILLKIVCMM